MDEFRDHRRYSGFWICAFLVALTLIAYWPVLSNGFVGYDDNIYVTENTHIQGGLTRAAIPYAFTTKDAGNWHPLTWLSHALDCQLYGLNPIGHHLTNLLLHIANVLLLFLILSRMTGMPWRSAVVAALFALHPLHVESVAWIAERKDVLSTLFLMLTMLAYVSYARRGGRLRHAHVVVLFALGLMAKPMLVTLPLLLLLLDYWPLGSPKSEAKPAFRQLALEKLSMLVLSAASCFVTYWVQKGPWVTNPLDSLPLSVRIDNAVVGYVTYLGKMLWPRNLAMFYPHPGGSLPIWVVVGSGMLVFCITALAVRLRKRYPYMLVGWIWYLVALIPVIGLVQVGEQAIADRYTYVPLIGVFIMIVWGIADLVEKISSRPITVLAPVAGALILILTACSWAQARCWHDSVTLFSHALQVTRGNYVAHLNLAVTLDQKGDQEQAMEHYAQALQLRPNWPEAHWNLGVTLGKQGDLNGAIREYRRALELRPDYVDAHYNLGLAFDEQKLTGAAIREYAYVIVLQPDHVQAHNNLAVALFSMGRYRQAWEQVHAAEELGFRPHPAFIQALAARMPEPGG